MFSYYLIILGASSKRAGRTPAEIHSPAAFGDFGNSSTIS